MTDRTQHDPGGKVLFPLPIRVRGNWIISKDEVYRYQLSRVWNEAMPILLVVMMDPSTARSTEDDPTVAKCRRYAED